VLMIDDSNDLKSHNTLSKPLVDPETTPPPTNLSHE